MLMLILRELKAFMRPLATEMYYFLMLSGIVGKCYGAYFFCRETIEAGSGCDAAYRLLNWFADQYYHEFSISTIQSQQLDGSVKEYYKELQVSIAFERFIVSLISHSLWDPNVEILAIIKERFQPFILKDIE